MRKNKASFWIFGALAAVLAVAALLICLTQRNAVPRLFGKTEGAEKCARAMMECISQGDYAGASAYLYGTPSLGTDAQRETPAAALIWDAFVSSLECRSQGSCYATDAGVAMDFTVSGLDIPSLTQELKQRSAAVLEARVEAAEDMSQVYDSNQQYREDFAQSVLEEAAREAVAAVGPVENAVTVQLVYEGNQWWVVPDSALMTAISGGIR
ncbi:MAG: hypothetical protein MR828_06025 [Clostridiales bacterium]|nr:hypothetical protein [Clostridiales bacterium]